MRKEELVDNVEKDIEFVTQKMEQFRKDNIGSSRLDVKQQADIQRYAQTRLSLVKTLDLLEKW